jgi:hypothetical protein
MTAFDFSKEVVYICSRHAFIQGIEIQLLDEPVVKIKAVLDNDTFINIFYNAETSKYSFALVNNRTHSVRLENALKGHFQGARQCQYLPSSWIPCQSKIP